MKTLFLAVALVVLGKCCVTAYAAPDVPIVKKGDRVLVITEDGKASLGVIITIDKKSIVLRLDKGGMSKIERAEIDEIRKLPKDAGTLPHRISLGNFIPAG